MSFSTTAASSSTAINNINRNYSSTSPSTIFSNKEYFEITSDNDIHLAIYCNNGKIGAAAYDSESTILRLMPDCIVSSNYQEVKRLMCQIGPRYVLLCKRNTEIIEIFQSFDNNDSGIPSDFIQICPQSDFQILLSKKRLLHCNLAHLPNNANEEERLFYLSSIIPFDCPCMIGSAGVLLKYLERNKVGVELEAIGTHVPLLDIHIFTLENVVLINDKCLRDLQVFNQCLHPSAFKKGIKAASKSEGFSLFSVLNHCQSTAGIQVLQSWLLQPSQNIPILEERYNAIDFLSSPCYQEYVTLLQSHLKHIVPFPALLARIHKSEASLMDWCYLYKSLCSMKSLGDVVTELEQTIQVQQNHKINILRQITEAVTAEFLQAGLWLTSTMEYDESYRLKRFVVRTGVDDQLDEKKLQYAELNNRLCEVNATEMARLRGVTECQVSYWPQMGFFLTIPISQMSPAESQKFNLTYVCTNYIDGVEYGYFKNELLRSLDDEFGDPENEIRDMEISIMNSLQVSIMARSQHLLHFAHLTSELDCLLALAISARELKLVRPVLLSQDDCDSGLIEIHGGRHPLQEFVVAQFIPNDFISGEVYPLKTRLHVITGPNASGKSIYLKQVALIIYMAQVGSFVPAESMVITPVDAIFTRLNGCESPTDGLSAFKLDLNQACEAVTNAGSKSLVILDEFANNTDDKVAMALISALMRFWLNKNVSSSSPHVLLATHLHQIFVSGLLLPLGTNEAINWQRMGIIHNEQSEESENKHSSSTENSPFVFSYQLEEGVCSHSESTKIALSAGLYSDIILRAEDVSISSVAQVSLKPLQNAGIHEKNEKKQQQLQHRLREVENRMVGLDLSNDQVGEIQALLTISQNVVAKTSKNVNNV